MRQSWLAVTMLTFSLFGNPAEGSKLMGVFCLEVAKIAKSPDLTTKQTLWEQLEKILSSYALGQAAEISPSEIDAHCQEKFSDDMEKLEFVLEGLRRVPALVRETEAATTLPIMTRELWIVDGIQVPAPAMETSRPSSDPLQRSRADQYKKLWNDLALELKQKVLLYPRAPY